MFTTPNTVYVPPDYQIETDVPSVAEFVTCSLDGRLWVYRRSRRYYVAVFRWDEETQRLVFVSTTVLNGETVIKRGVDWILTDKSLILSSDEDPYISRTEYDSDDTSYIDAINQSYSFFPEFETWQKIQSGQVIHIADAPNQEWQEMPNGLITPLEFHYYSDDDIQSVTDFTPKLCYCNGQLYAKGKAHIGRAYLLPRTFSRNGDIEDFYLYISPDYLRSYDKTNQAFSDNDGWDKLLLAPLNQNSACMFTPENENSIYCKKAENAQVSLLPQLEQLDYSANNGAIFFDGLTHSNLMLNNNGASFLCDNLSYECKGLKQWLAPSGKVDAVSSQSVISSFDNGTLVTYLHQGLYRELLTKKKLPLVIKGYSGIKLSLNDKDKNIQVNQTHLNIKSINSFECANYTNIFYDILESSTSLADYTKPFEGSFIPNFYYGKTLPITDEDFYDKYEPYFLILPDMIRGALWLPPYPMFVAVNRNVQFDYNAPGIFYLTYATIWLYYINPSTNQLVEVYLGSINMNDYCSELSDVLYDRYGRIDIFTQTIANTVMVELRNNTIGLVIRLETNRMSYDPATMRCYVEENYATSDIFVPLCNVPEEIRNWQSREQGDINDNEQGIIFEKIAQIGDTNKYHAVFSMPYHAQQFFVDVPIKDTFIHTVYHSTRMYPCAMQTFYDITSLQDKVYTKALSVTSYGTTIWIFHSEYHPEILDLEQEVERSNLS